MNRRQLLEAGLATAALTSVPGLTLAAAKPLKLLILGGTGFIGPHFVETARAHGHTLTLFNRGKRDADLFPDIEQILGDRDGQIDGLKGRQWDAVIDNSGYVPRHVQLSADLLHGNVGRYLFISSISVYESFAKPGLDEDDPVGKLADETVEKVDGETYGPLKALCERAVEQRYGGAATIVRPTYIVGPRDYTDRFTYWPVRVARGGEMLAPGTASDPVQIIDVRDLADFVIGCIERDVGGRYNTCSPPGAVTIGNVLETSRAVTRSDARFTWVSSDFLAANELVDSGEIPIWSPPGGDSAGAALVSPARAVAQGLRFRPLETTIRDTLAWQSARPAGEQEKMRAGLTEERERALLAEWRSSREGARAS